MHDATGHATEGTSTLWGGVPGAAKESPPVAGALYVLASSSSGNCSALVTGEGALRRVTLIDCGLTPLRTRVLLAEIGLDFSAIDEVLLTHLDFDHFCPTWTRKLPAHARVHVHRRHARRAAMCGLARDRMRTYEEAFELACGASVRPVLASHDELGVVAFRIGIGEAALGYATDLGRVPQRLADELGGVGVLAIESNYCPRMQESSPRPAFLKRRIMDGSGHLSNEQCAEAVAEIKPRDHVVLLHLSRDCNRPELAAAAHTGAPYRLSVAAADGLTGPIGL